MKEKGIQKYELTVMIEKNLSTNERKLQTEIQKLLSKNSQMQEINFVQMKKKRNRSVYAYFCTKTRLDVISLKSIANNAIKINFKKTT